MYWFPESDVLRWYKCYFISRGPNIVNVWQIGDPLLFMQVDRRKKIQKKVNHLPKRVAEGGQRALWTNQKQAKVEAGADHPNDQRMMMMNPYHPSEKGPVETRGRSTQRIMWKMKRKMNQKLSSKMMTTGWWQVKKKSRTSVIGRTHKSQIRSVGFLINQKNCECYTLWGF